MPINKIIPRFLVSDKDERLLENGAMTDAINVTISENGNGTEGVIKNMVGTIAANAQTGSALEVGNEIKAIGQASDSQRGFLYVFVADVDGSTQDAIYQYNTKSTINDGLGVNEFRIVYKGDWLNFDKDSFIKVDVVNAAFQQDDNIQTILYFTDNINPPRKINVDRAIDGDFDGLSDNDLDYALSAIKAPQTKPVTFGFATDTYIPVNNFARATFQFATQYIYKDGEESAISPYSKLAFSNVVAAESLEEDTGVLFFTDNRCDLFLNWINGSASPEDNPSDVEKIRILGRRGNEGSFFIIDEIDPRVDLERTIDNPSNQVTVYEASSGTYKFYNNGLYPSIPSATANKLYDNVPQKAAGQCVSNNRLFYSNYTEGYANHSVDAVWGVSYGSERGGGQVIFDGSEGLVTETSVEENGVNTNYQLNIEFTDSGSPLQAAGDTVPSGSLYSLSFDFIPKFDLFTDGGTINTITASVDNGSSTYNIDLSLGDPTLSPKNAARIDGGSFSYSTQIGSVPGESVQDFRDRFLAHLDNELGDITFSHDIDLTSSPVVLNYEITSDGGNSDFTIGDTIEDHVNSFSGSIKVEYKFSSLSSGSTQIIILPYVSKISSNGDISLSFSNGSGATASDTFSFSKTFNSYTQQRLYNYNNSATDAVDLSQNIAYYFITNSAQKTFKAGCHHDFGVVYYDKYGRSGNVNKIGGFYAKFPGERSPVDGGAVSARVTVTNSAPSWADSWQLVYGGMQDYDRVFTYTTGKAYPALTVDDTGTVGSSADANRKQIYVAMIGLDEYQSERGALRNYSFTEGDKLRVVKHKTTNGTTWTYPLANDGVSLIEFNVVGVEILGNSNNPLAATPTNEHKGTFLVLEAPLVAGGVDGQGVTTDLKYPGFDWFTVSGTTYPDSTSVGDIYWGRDSVVEIVTPKKVAQQVYYEVGERRAVKTYKSLPNTSQTNETGLSAWTNHGPTVIVDSTDTYLRQVPCKGPVYGGSSWTTNSPAAYEYTSIEMESQDLSDFFVSDDWDKGRAFVYYEPSATVRRFNGITYSDAYAEDVSVLSLSSFNASLANFYSVDSKYGKLNYIGAYNEDIVGVQENKFSLIPIGKNIIEYAQGSGNVTVSTDVVGQPRYSSGDYGCGDNPESVLIQDGNVFFADKSRSSVLWFSGSQLVPISEQNTSSLFQNFFELGGDRYVSGYDPEDNIYYISSTADTVGYDLTRQVWQSRYSFIPDLYINQNNMMYSTKNKTTQDPARILWSHSGDSNGQYNNFYGSNYDSSVQVVFNDFPSLVKVFNAISYEGSSDSWDMDTGMVTDLGQTSGTIEIWDYREGSYYKYMPRDTADKYLYVGKADNPSGLDIPLKDNLNLIKLSFSPAGSYVYYGSSKEQGAIINSVGSNSVTVVPNIGLIANDDEIHFKVPNDGDTMRGHWAKVTFNLTSSTKNELYCINLHTAESKLSH